MNLSINRSQKRQIAGMSIVQFKKIGERSNRRWNGSRELIQMQLTFVNHRHNGHVAGCETRYEFAILFGWMSYRSRRLMRDPMVDGMVPESWLENKYLPSNNRVNHMESVNKERSYHLQLKIGERVSEWRIDWLSCHISWALHHSTSIEFGDDVSHWKTWGWDGGRCSSVQVLKIGERSNGRWNGSRELIGVQLSVIQHHSRACKWVLGKQEREIHYRTSIEGWWAMRQSMELCHWVDLSTPVCCQTSAKRVRERERESARSLESDNNSVGNEKVGKVAVVQVLKIDKGSNRRWNGSRELIRV